RASVAGCGRGPSAHRGRGRPDRPSPSRSAPGRPPLTPAPLLAPPQATPRQSTPRPPPPRPPPPFGSFPDPPPRTPRSSAPAPPTTATSVGVPPPSQVSTRLIPALRAIIAAPTAPAAGPLSTVLIGCPITCPAVTTPPLEVITCSGEAPAVRVCCPGVSVCR